MGVAWSYAVNEDLHPLPPHSFMMRAGVVVGAIAWAGSRAQQGLGAAATGAGMTSPSEAAKPADAVLVFGSTGKLGRLVVKQVRHALCPFLS
jgi:hypothetical protein